MADVSDAKRRIIERLKRVDGATASELAELFGLTDTAVRQHLEGLAALGLVEHQAQPTAGSRGRPPSRWSLAAAAAELFPDRHVDLAVEIIGAVSGVLGPGALDEVLARRAASQVAAYRAAGPPPSAPLVERVAALARARTAEGYLADVETEPTDGGARDGAHLDGRGVYVLVEHHCPVADAARSCQGLCASELAVFQATLGDDVTVERTRHLLAGDRRCAYRIAPVGAASPT